MRKTPPTNSSQHLSTRDICNFGNIVVAVSFKRAEKRRFFRFERFPWCLSNAISGRKVLYLGSQSTLFRVAIYVISGRKVTLL